MKLSEARGGGRLIDLVDLDYVPLLMRALLTMLNAPRACVGDTYTRSDRVVTAPNNEAATPI